MPERIKHFECARNGFQALPKHLAALSEGGGRHSFEHERIDAFGLICRDQSGRSRSSPSAAARTTICEPASRSSPSHATGRRPQGAHNGRYPVPATIRSATSRWNIKVSERHHGGHSSPPSQRSSNAVPTLYGKIGDDMRAVADLGALVDLERIALDQSKAVAKFVMRVRQAAPRSVGRAPPR